MKLALLLASLGCSFAHEYPHYVPACGSCGTAEAAADQAAREHKSLAEQADAASRAAAGEAHALGLSAGYQAQYAGKAAFQVYQKAQMPLASCSYEAAKEAADTAKANGLDIDAQLNAGAVTAALSLASIGQSGQQQADGAFAAAKALTQELLPASKQAAALDTLDGPISFITGVLPTGRWHPGPGSLGTPSSPVNEEPLAPAAAPVEEVVMDINSDVSGTALRERGLPGWAWFFISFAVAAGLAGSVIFCYRNMGDSRDSSLLEEDEEDELE
ncbi:unnamed protein product [Durusdinium trenchii]|uniref:Hyalin n=2 Tax=Durusdinium trenchii TaxID=1381693 RepID=A0ABP0QIC5_9DINO